MNPVESIGVGSVLDDRYVLERPVGAGGFGAVFEAMDRRVGRRVAIKVMQTPEPRVAASFRREANLLASVDSPHVVRILDAVLEREAPYLVMELLVGTDLREHIRQRGPVPTPQALQITKELLRGLRAMHRRAIVHLDIKPGNVILTPNGTKLIDFGISRAGREAGWDPKQVNGTPPYLAPELLARAEPDVRTDLYGVGLLLYEMLAGRPAYDSARTLEAVLDDVRIGRRTPLRVHCPWLDLPITSFVRMALSAEPDDRFGNAEEMLTALALVLRTVDEDQPAASSRPVPQPVIAGVVAATRVEALTKAEGVKERYLRRGGQARFFDQLAQPWVSLAEYCRLLDSAYAVLGQSVLAEVTRDQIVRESREGPFVAAARVSPDQLGVLLAGYWNTAFRAAGRVQVTHEPHGVQLTIVGASTQIRSSPG